MLESFILPGATEVKGFKLEQEGSIDGGSPERMDKEQSMETLYILEINDANFEDEIERSTLPLVLDFWGAGCAPCARFAPVFADAAERHAGRIRFGKVNAHENHDLCAEFQITAMPTILFLKDGKEIARYRGAMSTPTFEERLAEAFGN